MKFNFFPMGHLSQGDTIQVIIDGDAPNVRLMDGYNFSKYKAGNKCTFHGGIPKFKRTTLGVPSSGDWYVVIDYDGLRGSARVDVRLI